MDSDECERALEDAEKRIAELELSIQNDYAPIADYKEAQRRASCFAEKLEEQAQCIKEMREALAEAEQYIYAVLIAYDESFPRHPAKERGRFIIVSDLEKARAALARWPE